jgi:hypothetical protein
VLNLVLATIVALWLPVQSAGIQCGNASLPNDGSAQTEQPSPSQSVDFGPRLISGSGGSWQARHAHDAHAPEICPPGLDVVYVAVSKKTAQLRVHVGRPGRTFPLLI